MLLFIFKSKISINNCPTSEGSTSKYALLQRNLIKYFNLEGPSLFLC